MLSFGDPEGIRTPGLLIRSQTLYPAELLSHVVGTHFHPGTNVGIGKDDTLFALVPGKVAFERAGRYNRKVSVYPVEA